MLGGAKGLRRSTFLVAVVFALGLTVAGAFIVNLVQSGSLSRNPWLGLPLFILPLLAAVLAAINGRWEQREAPRYRRPTAGRPLVLSAGSGGLPDPIDEFTGRRYELERLRKALLAAST